MHHVRGIGDRRVDPRHGTREQRQARQQLDRGQRGAEPEPGRDPPQFAPGSVAQRPADRPADAQRNGEVRHLRMPRHEDERGGERQPPHRPPGTRGAVEHEVERDEEPGDPGHHRDLWVLQSLPRDHARADERDGADEPGRRSQAQPVREHDHPDGEHEEMECSDQDHGTPRIEPHERQLERIEQPDLGIRQVGHPAEDGGVPLGQLSGEQGAERHRLVGRRIRIRVETLDDAARAQEWPRHEGEKQRRTEQLEPTCPPEVTHGMRHDHAMVKLLMLAPGVSLQRFPPPAVVAVPGDGRVERLVERALPCASRARSPW